MSLLCVVRVHLTRTQVAVQMSQTIYKLFSFNWFKDLVDTIHLINK